MLMNNDKKKLKELEKRIEELEAELERVKKERQIPPLAPQPIPIPSPQPFPTFPDPIISEGTTCTKCGMVWKGVMGYCCPHGDCPMGAGPIMC